MLFYFIFCFRIIIPDSLPFEAVQDLGIMTQLGALHNALPKQHSVHWANCAPGRALIVRPTPPRHRISLNLIFYTSHHGDQFNWAPDHLPHICSIFWVWLSICWCTLLLDRTQRSVWIEFDWLMGISGCTWPQGWVMQHPSHQSIYRWSIVGTIASQPKNSCGYWSPWSFEVTVRSYITALFQLNVTSIDFLQP